MTENHTLKATSELVITRTFDAPRELVFQVFTQAEHLQHWWGPKGCKIEVSKMDLRPGGIFHYSMGFPDGGKMWGKFTFQEIVAPEKLVFLNAFSDEEGNTVQPAFSADFPLEVLNIMTFTENEGKTTLTVRGGPHNGTEANWNFYKSMHESMQQGFGGTFDQLDQYLASIK